MWNQHHLFEWNFIKDNYFLLFSFFSSIQNIILSPQPVMNMSTGLGKLLTSSTTPTVIQQGGIQYTLQPAPASVTSAAAQVTAAGLSATQVNGAAGQLTSIGAKTVTQKSKAQPQLLPKPASNSSLISTGNDISSDTSNDISNDTP